MVHPARFSVARFSGFLIFYIFRLRGRRLKEKGKEVLSAKETRGGGGGGHLKTPFPFPFKHLPRRS